MRIARPHWKLPGLRPPGGLPRKNSPLVCFAARGHNSARSAKSRVGHFLPSWVEQFGIAGYRRETIAHITLRRIKSACARRSRMHMRSGYAGVKMSPAEKEPPRRVNSRFYSGAGFVWWGRRLLLGRDPVGFARRA